MKTPNARSTKTSAAAGRRKTPAGATTKATRGKKKKQVVASEEITSNKVLYAQWEIEHPLFEDDAAFLASLEQPVESELYPAGKPLVGTTGHGKK